jgi:hypothetical protein
MTPIKNINRRKFIGAAVATTATISIVPRHVLGGKGFVAPSDKITVANIGCGTQGLREMPDMLQNEEMQVVAVCDVNKSTTDYLDWSANGIRNGIRRTLGDDAWGQILMEFLEDETSAKNMLKSFMQKMQHQAATKGVVLMKTTGNYWPKKKTSMPLKS